MTRLEKNLYLLLCHLSSFHPSQSSHFILCSVPPFFPCSSVLLALTIVHFSLFTISKLPLPRIWSATFRFWFTFYYLCSRFGLNGSRFKHWLSHASNNVSWKSGEGSENLAAQIIPVHNQQLANMYVELRIRPATQVYFSYTVLLYPAFY